MSKLPIVENIILPINIDDVKVDVVVESDNIKIDDNKIDDEKNIQFIFNCLIDAENTISYEKCNFFFRYHIPDGLFPLTRCSDYRYYCFIPQLVLEKLMANKEQHSIDYDEFKILFIKYLKYCAIYHQYNKINHTANDICGFYYQAMIHCLFCKCKFDELYKLCDDLFLQEKYELSCGLKIVVSKLQKLLE